MKKAEVNTNRILETFETNALEDIASKSLHIIFPICQHNQHQPSTVETESLAHGNAPHSSTFGTANFRLVDRQKARRVAVF